MIAVLDYGMGNIHSILKALRLYAAEVVYTKDPQILRAASAIVLPGDGAFPAAMESLRRTGMESLLKEWAAAMKPLLGICIGFQVLFEDSTEGDHLTQGLGLLQGKIRRFSFLDATRVPHMGWNSLLDAGGTREEFMYFVHSYYATDCPEACVRFFCEYGGVRFPAAVEKGTITAFQFHPEKSGPAGLALLKQWVSRL